MKKKISLKEILRRSLQKTDNSHYQDGKGGTFTMTKVKNGFKLNP